MIKFITLTNRISNRVEHVNVSHIVKIVPDPPTEKSAGTSLYFINGKADRYLEDGMTVINRVIAEIPSSDGKESGKKAGD